MASTSRPPDNARLDRIVAEARRARDLRETTYRERALAIYPWVCGRCAREFDRTTVSQLTVHHRDHNHDNNPPDGSNWELLCLYCHDDEHDTDAMRAMGDGPARTDAGRPSPIANPFEGLGALLGGDREPDRA